MTIRIGKDLDTRDDSAWAHLSAHLCNISVKINTLNQKLRPRL
jgi:hypothetical protein